ncbi:MAG: (Fe-S)-binding protein, partial [Gammaproteobacteria bacterium]|nr:(Fe-S)-binding protein [Gammaproteobacteria bacterium]
MYKPDLSAADQCVMCGMCQPHCPTYRAEHIETESPRGRLSMILGLAQNQLKADQSIIEHLNSCAGCGACEAMCPSRVPFMQLMDNSKHLLPRKSLVLKVLLQLVRHPARYNLLSTILKNQKFGSLLRLFGFLDKSSKSLQKTIQKPQSNKRLEGFYQARGEIRGNLGLFTGCITQLFDQATLHDTITLLTHCGYNVHISAQQVCCGALHQHNGEIDTAQLLIKQNQQVFQTKTLDAVIFTATGCGAQLKSQLKNIVIMDIIQFINENKLLDQLQLSPIASNILVHEPCSQRNQLKLPDITPLISRIPDLKTNNLIENQFCCGAGGINMLTNPETANRLRSVKIKDIESQSPDIVVTTNYGCALHLA